MGLLISENALSQSILSQVANLKSKVKKNEYFTEREFMDSTGNVLFTISFDKDDAIENNPMGFAIIANKFDAKGNVVERKFLDKNEIMRITSKEKANQYQAPQNIPILIT